jgi:hypothetical protein
MFIQILGGFRVIERFFLHYMTPVACRIADADEHRYSSATGGFERSISPWIPVDRVVSVLLKVRACLEKEAVRVNG